MYSFFLFVCVSSFFRWIVRPVDCRRKKSSIENHATAKMAQDNGKRQGRKKNIQDNNNIRVIEVYTTYPIIFIRVWWNFPTWILCFFHFSSFFFIFLFDSFVNMYEHISFFFLCNLCVYFIYISHVPSLSTL